ncbi:MAG: hypothetical protein ACREJ3_14170, partial [Polyangiaceae bacterium]
MAEDAATRATDGANTFLLAQAGTIAWRQLGNLIRAKVSFERLSVLSPGHPEVRAFEAQIGEPLTAAAALHPTAVAPAQVIVPTPPETPAPGGTGNVVPAESPVAVAPPPVMKSSAAVAPPLPVMESSAAVAPPPAVDDAKIAELRQLAEKQEASKRYNEYVRTLLQLAALLPDAGEKVALLVKAADLYVSKFANQAEAVKAYEAVLAIDPDNAQAAEYLRQMYEKRRDWEKLLGLQRREAERLPAGAGRAAKFLEIAKLATERVKKPELCMDLWQEVLANDQDNVEALGALAGLCERAKDFGKLAVILERQAEITQDAHAKIQVLAKLAALYGDRLSNDEGAVNAWRA